MEVALPQGKKPLVPVQ